jgi:hypothetical protein
LNEITFVKGQDITNKQNGKKSVVYVKNHKQQKGENDLRKEKGNHNKKIRRKQTEQTERNTFLLDALAVCRVGSHCSVGWPKSTRMHSLLR